MNTQKFNAVLIGSLFLLAGCGSPTIKGNIISQKLGAEMPDLISVLPPDNHSNDLTAVEVIQRAGGAALVGHGYYAVSNKAQDAALQKMGITDGGQLMAFKAADICRNLGAQGLLYSVVEDFNEINIGFWQSKKVKFNLKMTDCEGENLWEGDAMFRVRLLTINPQAALQNFASRAIGQVLESALKVHLVGESNMAALKLGEKITPWPNDPKAQVASSGGGRMKAVRKR